MKAMTPAPVEAAGHRVSERMGALLDRALPARTKRPDPDTPERTRLLVPQMPHEYGLSCDWHCLPDSIEPECLIHSGYLKVDEPLHPLRRPSGWPR